MNSVATEKTSWIQKTPGMCGGNACIRNTRITVWGHVRYQQLGLSDHGILNAIQGLTPDDLEVAWEYYASNRDEIEEQIRLNEDA